MRKSLVAIATLIDRSRFRPRDQRRSRGIRN